MQTSKKSICHHEEQQLTKANKILHKIMWNPKTDYKRSKEQTLL